MDDPILTFLGLARVGVGAFTWLFPSHSMYFFGLDEPNQKPTNKTPGQEVVIRLFGVRDLVLGGSLLLATHTEARKLSIQMGLVCDSVDTLAMGIATYKQIGWRGRILTGAGAALFAVLGIYGLQTIEERARI